MPCCVAECARYPPPSAGTVATGSGGRGSAAAGEEMVAGVHCAHFTLRKADSRNGHLPRVGVVGAGFDAARDKCGAKSHKCAEGWVLNPDDGTLRHGDDYGIDWAGKAAAEQLEEGDVVVRSRPAVLLAAGG